MLLFTAHYIDPLNGPEVAIKHSQQEIQQTDCEGKTAMHGGRELVFDAGETVDKERVKGAINEVVGRAKRQVGEWTGDTNAQVEGLAQEMQGKVQKAWGNVKDAARTERGKAREELKKSDAK
ncbi:MAG TPA: CsbD family protein [Terracidiphilus sp.]|jgi:uncharacterized protein YjbJ (UPF0337 family)